MAGPAESIIKGGEITPGSSGNIWVTPDRYVDGATAQSRLALGRTPDGYFEIPVCRVSCPSSPSSRHGAKPLDPTQPRRTLFKSQTNALALGQNKRLNRAQDPLFVDGFEL